MTKLTLVERVRNDIVAALENGYEVLEMNDEDLAIDLSTYSGDGYLDETLEQIAEAVSIVRKERLK